MTTKWVGMPDREAFVEIFTEVKNTMEYAHRMRGETMIWRLEAIIEYKGEPNDFK